MKARPFGTIARGLVLSMIDTCPDLRTRRDRIRIAVAEGILSPEEGVEKMDIADRLEREARRERLTVGQS